MYTEYSAESPFIIAMLGSGSSYTYSYLGFAEYNSSKNLRIYPSGTVSADSFSGNLTGTATNATNINTLADNSTNAARFILFSDAATGNQRAKTDSGLKYNPSSNTITAKLAGNASSATYASAVTLTADNASNATRYPLFVSAATGNLSPRTDTGFTYNPSTGALTSTTFIGALSGKATSAGNADTANGQKFNWSNSSNSPTYLWAASTNGTAFLASRADISVKYATSAGSITGFTSGKSNSGEHNANNISSNGMWYYTSNGPTTAQGSSTNDGALYSQAHSTA